MITSRCKAMVLYINKNFQGGFSMDDILFNVLKAVTVFVIGVIMRYFIPWVKEKIANTKFEVVLTWVTKFVEAAEQTIIGSSDKKTYVTEKLKELLQSKNLALPDDQISALIEATVNELYPNTEETGETITSTDTAVTTSETSNEVETNTAETTTESTIETTATVEETTILTNAEILTQVKALMSQLQ